MAANGRLPASQLAPIPGSGPYGAPRLRRDVAAAYNALHRESMRRYGVSMALHEGGVGRAYRSYQRQVLAKRTYGSNAAEPGSSNHGWGTTVDLANRQQRWVVDRIGSRYGFAKRCSDASWEWWHIKYNPSCAGARWRPMPAPRPLRLTKDERAAIYRLRKLRGRRSTAARRDEIRDGKEEILRLRQDIRDAADRDGWNKNDRKRRYRALLDAYQGRRYAA